MLKGGVSYGFLYGEPFRLMARKRMGRVEGLQNADCLRNRQDFKVGLMARVWKKGYRKMVEIPQRIGRAAWEELAAAKTCSANMFGLL